MIDCNDLDTVIIDLSNVLEEDNVAVEGHFLFLAQQPLSEFRIPVLDYDVKLQFYNTLLFFKINFQLMAPGAFGARGPLPRLVSVKMRPVDLGIVTIQHRKTEEQTVQDKVKRILSVIQQVVLVSVMVVINYCSDLFRYDQSDVRNTINTCTSRIKMAVSSIASFTFIIYIE